MTLGIVKSMERLGPSQFVGQRELKGLGTLAALAAHRRSGTIAAQDLLGGLLLPGQIVKKKD